MPLRSALLSARNAADEPGIDPCFYSLLVFSSSLLEGPGGVEISMHLPHLPMRWGSQTLPKTPSRLKSWHDCNACGKGCKLPTRQH
jgi:hypothetical protein